mmetsp:Transcript_38533/g.111317  ORF Transcript_38533/g.111317 Transcript_38533/m.111317 type:complete len:222 (+) Transcript_38533:1820-2485(+)
MMSFTVSMPQDVTPAFMSAISVGEPMYFPGPWITVALLRIPCLIIFDGKSLLSSLLHLEKSSVKVALPERSTVTISRSVISPEVRVPVLSEQTTETQPRVSTASSLRMSTLWADIFSDAIMREIVTVGMRPSGTWAKRAPAALAMMYPIGCCVGEKRLETSEARPTMTATMAMRCTKCSICISSVDLDRAALMLLAILPRKVLSPMKKTIAVQLPLTTVVP